MCLIHSDASKENEKEVKTVYGTENGMELFIPTKITEAKTVAGINTVALWPVETFMHVFCSGKPKSESSVLR